MAKFASARTRPTGPITTTGKTTTTAQGAPAYARDVKSDLFLLAINNMVGEDTYYEKAGKRDQRFRDLIHQAVREDPDWVAGLIPWLRNEANMRSASVVAAAEYTIARREPGAYWPAHHTTRKVIDSALQRPDEPAEFIAYWKQRTGRTTLPGGVQRGLADAITRLYTERAALKYDGVNSLWRQADLIALAKPHPADERQADLFDYLADRRWNRETVRVTEKLPVLSLYRHAMTMPQDERRAWFLADPGRLRRAGMTWEQLSSLGPMDRDAWEAIIPSMGAMALTRNLRNFDEAGVSDKVAAVAAMKLTDEQEIRRSRQHPYRFWSAYQEAPSLRWSYPLERALAHSCANIPVLDGRTLVLVDTSGSMETPVSGRSKIRMVDVGALFGVALAARGNDVTLCGFASGVFHHDLVPGGSVLSQVQSFSKKVGSVGHGTCALEAVAACLKAEGRTGSKRAFKRVVLISDMQTAKMARTTSMYGYTTYASALRGQHTVSDVVPKEVTLFGWNIGGYSGSQINASVPGRYELGGFTDKAFTLMGMLDRGISARWPWEEHG